MKVLVTGASGRLGRRVIEHLHQAGHEPVGVDRRFSHRVECRFEMVDLLDWMAVYRVT
jgi:nucleoside-diphosphate-sugar epimerase